MAYILSINIIDDALPHQFSQPYFINKNGRAIRQSKLTTYVFKYLGPGTIKVNEHWNEFAFKYKWDMDRMKMHHGL